MNLDLVHDTQKAYRKLLRCMSRPGIIESIKKQSEKIDFDISFYKSTLVTMYVLLDGEVTFNIVSTNKDECRLSSKIDPKSELYPKRWILFMLETNIRSSTLIGLLTGTGIGYTFSMYYQSMNYNAASLVVISIVLSVFIIEFISNYVRRVIL